MPAPSFHFCERPPRPQRCTRDSSILCWAALCSGAFLLSGPGAYLGHFRVLSGRGYRVMHTCITQKAGHSRSLSLSALCSVAFSRRVTKAPAAGVSRKLGLGKRNCHCCGDRYNPSWLAGFCVSSAANGPESARGSGLRSRGEVRRRYEAVIDWGIPTFFFFFRSRAYRLMEVNDSRAAV